LCRSVIHRDASLCAEAASPQIASNARLWPITWRFVSAVSALLARMILNDLQALSVGPLVSKEPIAQPVRRNALDRIASGLSFLGIDVAPLLDARTLSLHSALFCLPQPAPIPGHDHRYEANGQADLEPMRGEQQAGAG